jgi:prepilin-type processing-associated H-X9-DG protein
MKPPFTFKKNREAGFTFVELLVVLATLAVLAVMLLPAIAGTKPNSQAFQCLENLRQLTLGWQIYAEDNSGKLAPNGNQYEPNPPVTSLPDSRILPGAEFYQWCPGNMSAYSPIATNLVMAGAIYPYVNTNTVYKCPADHSSYKFGATTIPHVRSYSMNCYLSPVTEGLTPPAGQWTGVGSMGTRNFFKDTDLIRPGPAMTFVFIEENEYSINDGFFVSDPSQGNFWQDIPASRHAGSGGLSYADGHTEMKRWTDSKILGRSGPTGQLPGSSSSSDAAWLEHRATSVNQ